MTTTPETRIQQIATTIATARERLEAGHDVTIELAPLLDEATRLERMVETRGIELNEAQWQQAEQKRPYIEYRLQRCTTPAEVLGMVEAARTKGDVVELFVIASNLPVNSAGRALAERPLVDVKGLRQQLRRDATRIRDLRAIPAEKRRQTHELKQSMQRVSEDELVARKRQQYSF